MVLDWAPVTEVSGGSLLMQPFICPQCGHQSGFDPWVESARCPECGFSPPADGPRHNYIQWAQRVAYQAFLDELSSHWQGSHTPEPAFALDTPQDAEEFLRKYHRLVGLEAPNYRPNREEMLVFAESYALLRRGERAEAAEGFGALVLTSPLFVEPWIWLTATTDDPVARRKYLENATRLDSAHALARDALVLLQNQEVLSSGGRRQAEEIAAAKCPQCGGTLQYEPGAAEVECTYCGHLLKLWERNLVDEAATPLHHLRLRRRYEGHTWAAGQRIVRCLTCGAELVMTEHLAGLCSFCGSANVLLADNERVLEQPDSFLPFQVERQQAERAVHQVQRSILRRFLAWWAEEEWQLRELQGVYLPFWVFDGIVETYQIYKGMATQQKESLTWDTHENLLFPGVSVPPRSVLVGVYPFELSVLTPYEPRLLANWPARLYNRDVELVAEEARQDMLDRTRHLAPRRGILDKQQVDCQVIGLTYQLVLLPVWLALLESQEQRCLVVVSGQTGKAAMSSAFPIVVERHDAPGG
jgi:DNA-directed RNA polymerase subunit RPC12/RpoP